MTQKADASTGLMYYGARYYDTGLGRFLSADTIVPNAANPQALNRYAYTLNNPVKYVDPTGHRTCANSFTGGVECTDSGVEPRMLPAQQTFGFVYAAAIENAFNEVVGSPVAQFYIDYARRHQVGFELGRITDLVGNSGGMVTVGNTIFIGSDYAIAVPSGDTSFTLDFDPNRPLPADILIHELVHVYQNDTQGTLLNSCGCSLEREREAMTVQGAVLNDIGSSCWKTQF